MRIYIDKNVFSYLRIEDKFKPLKDYLYKIKKYHCFFYSNAHFEDLLNDKTEKKYEDLNFMETIVDDNLLCKYWNTDLNCYIATPNAAFKHHQKYHISLKDINFEDLRNHPNMQEKIYKTEHFFKSAKVESIDLNKCPDHLRIYLENILKQTRDFNFNQLIENGIKYMVGLQENNKVYKEMRRINIENKKNIFNKHINLNESNLDEIFENSIFKTNFIDFIKKNIHFDIKTPCEEKYYLFLVSFFALNSLGLDSEKNKKAKFSNTINDGLHAYYAGLCDIFITDDVGIIEKCNILYKKFNIDTIILKPNEFLDYMCQIDSEEIKKPIDLQERIPNDFINGKIFFFKEIDKSIFLKIYTQAPYFHYFKILQFELDKKTKVLKNITLIPSNEKIESIVIYKDIRIVTNNCVSIFGNDINGNSEFQDCEINEIINKNWRGRTWIIQNGIMTLNISKQSTQFYFNIYITNVENLLAKPK